MNPRAAANLTAWAKARGAAPRAAGFDASLILELAGLTGPVTWQLALAAALELEGGQPCAD